MAVRVTVSGEPVGGAAQRLKDEQTLLRGRIVVAIKVVFGFFSTMLALAALFVVLGRNVSADNPVVRFVWDVANFIDGPFSKDGGVFRFHGAKGAKLDAVVNWGIAAIIYAAVGKIFRWLLMPHRM